MQGGGSRSRSEEGQYRKPPKAQAMILAAANTAQNIYQLPEGVKTSYNQGFSRSKNHQIKTTSSSSQ